MNKLMSAISILFMVMLVESSSAVSALKVDPSAVFAYAIEEVGSSGSTFSIEDDLSSSGSYSVEDGLSAGGAYAIEDGSGGAGSFLVELFGGSAGSVSKFSQYLYLFH